MHSRKLFLSIFPVILLLFVGATPKQAEAQQPTPEPPPGHPYPLKGLADLPHVPSTTPYPDLLVQPASSTTINDIYTRFAFESFRNQDWEIYSAVGDKTNQTRLTYSPGVDMHPRLNRGCTQIIFSSNRTGNYEIYRMKVDGSGITQLTNSPADDVYPIWSPDGLKIAFQSYRDGQAEIYTMNQDGGALTRLTAQNSYDGEPYWSPDGSKIAFTSNRSGGYRIWVMNSDGSRLMLLSGQVSSQNPVWSSRGNWIAYTADSDGDEWLEIWLMNSDGTDQRLLYRPLSQRDAISTGWSPAGGDDPEMLVITEIEWIYYENQWYWITSNIRSVFYDGFNWYPPTYGNIFGAVEMNADWQSADVWPPVTSINPLPKYSRASGFTVSWAGTDLGSYILMWFPQYRLGEGGTWVNWDLGGNLTQKNYSGTPGSRVFFRVRALDAASNYEDWPTEVNGDTDTTLYSKQLAGLVIDPRGKGIPNVEINTSPAALNDDLGDLKGQFVRYMVVPTTTLTISKTNYGTLPPAFLNFNADINDWWALPPPDNAMVNGGFETGSFQGWQTSPGGSLTQDTALRHTGNAAALLGRHYRAENQKIWSTASTYYQGYTQVISDSSGNKWMVWVENTPIAGDSTPGRTDLFYSEFSAGGGWAAPGIAIPAHPGSPFYPKLALGTDGTLHLAWLESASNLYTVMHASKPSLGAWSEAETIFGPASNLKSLALAVDSQGNAHASWLQEFTGTWYAQKLLGQSWSVPEKITTANTSQSLTVGPDDLVHVVWYGGSGNVVYSTRPAIGAWSTPITIATLPNNTVSYELKILADPLGSLIVLWLEQGRVGFIEKKTGQPWTAPSEVISSTDLISDYQADINPASQLHLTWYEYNRDSTLNYRIRFPDGTLSKPFSFTTSSSYDWDTSFSSDEKDRADFSWVNKPSQSPRSVNHLEFLFDSSQTVWISQTVPITAGMHRPTLSLAYRVQADPGGGEFQIKLNDSIVFTQTASSTGWQHDWADISSFAGTSPTLTFSMTNSSPELLFEVHLDDISVGAWQTPVIQEVNPSRIINWTSARIAITGTNFISTPVIKLGDTLLSDVTWTDEGHLSALIPESIQCGKYDLWVINPGGQEAVLEQSLFLVCRKFLPTVTK